MRHLANAVLLAVVLGGGALLSLAGCAFTDPYEREGVWRPNGANAANIVVQVAVPSDLVRGVATTTGDGQQAAAALDRQRRDKVRALPDSGVAKVTPVSSGTLAGAN